MNVMRKQNPNKTEVIELSKEDEKQLKNLKQKINDILSEECVLCGDYMIESTQTLFVEEDNIKWGL
jgi:GTPase Era involved in 16S rRNA processing